MTHASVERDLPETIDNPGCRNLETGVRSPLSRNERLGRFTLAASNRDPPPQNACFAIADQGYTHITLGLIHRRVERQLQGVGVELANILNAKTQHLTGRQSSQQDHQGGIPQSCFVGWACIEQALHESIDCAASVQSVPRGLMRGIPHGDRVRHAALEKALVVRQIMKAHDAPHDLEAQERGPWRGTCEPSIESGAAQSIGERGRHLHSQLAPDHSGQMIVEERLQHRVWNRLRLRPQERQSRVSEPQTMPAIPIRQTVAVVPDGAVVQRRRVPEQAADDRVRTGYHECTVWDTALLLKRIRITAEKDTDLL